MRQYSLSSALCIGSLLIGLQNQALIASALADTNPLKVLQESFSVPSKPPLYNQAQLITVKVLFPEDGSWGSGILIQRQGSVYTVLTNEHVVMREGSYTIQLYNGQKYNAQKFAVGGLFNGDDLALLQFESTQNYPIASLKAISGLKEGDKVFAVGYPYQPESEDNGKFSLVPGQISFLGLEQPLV
ncbi:MAG: hypothetical protein F6J86_41875, partial [Symploca sp. SIO1B1]|nr:hypothetical protein [Symploca sp. SIO1B1]